MKRLFGLLFLMVALSALAARPSVASEGTLRFGILSFPESRGNPFMAIGPPYFYIWPALFDGLTVIDAEGNVMPALAESWHFTDPNTWIFKLRPGVAFANGEPVDAEAVAATLAYLLLPDSARFSAYNAVRGISGVRALDPLTLEIVTATPDRLLPNRIGAIAIVPPRYWAEAGPDGFAAKPIGTGPYVVETWASGRIAAKANPQSWRAPRIGALEIRQVPESTTRVQALLSGALDVALGIGPDDKDIIESVGGGFFRKPRGSVEGIIFNTMKDSPLQDRRVRQALNYAVDKNAIVDGLLHGLAAAASQTAAPGVFGRDPALEPYPYDPGKARALLAEAGYPDGFDMVTEVVPGRMAQGGAIYQKVADDLAQVGVRMELRAVPQTKIMRAAYDGSFEGIAFSMNYGSLPYMDALAGLRLHSCLWQSPWNCNPDFAERIRQAYATFDLAEREKLTRALVRDVREDAPLILLIDDVVFDGLSPRVRNYSAAFSFINYEEIELED